jgi:hypothetical protein
MALSVTETRAVLLASLVIVMTETVGISGTAQVNTTISVARVEQVAAVGTSRIGLNPMLIEGTESVGVEGNPTLVRYPLFITMSESLKVWEWRVFPLGEHEVYGVPIRVFMKGRT